MKQKKIVKRISKKKLDKIFNEAGLDKPLPFVVSQKGLRALADFAARKK